MKLGPAPRSVPAYLLVLMAGAGCGYRSANPGGESRAALSIAAAPLKTPHPEALQAALAGARAELLRAGGRTTSGYPALVVEILRVDELAAGMQAVPASNGLVPLARASSVGVVGRAWIVERAGAEPTRRTGDVRRVETVVQGGEPLASRFALEGAVRGAARRLGEALVRRALGTAPEPSVEPMG